LAEALQSLLGPDAKGISPNVVVRLKEKWGLEYEEWSQLIQMEAVSDRVKPITLRVAVYDGEEPITDIQNVKFESSSGNLDEQKKWVSLVLKERQYNKKTPYRLVLRDAETSIEQQSVEVIIDRAFTDDF